MKNEIKEISYYLLCYLKDNLPKNVAD